MTKVVIVDDVLYQSKFIRKETKTIDCSFVPPNGYEFLQKLHTARDVPDIVVLDVEMMMIDGIALTHYIKHHFPDIKVILTCSSLDSSLPLQILGCGANGIMIRQNMRRELENAINSVERNTLFIDNEVVDVERTIVSKNILTSTEERFGRFGLTKRERTFTILNATKLQYAEIAKLMFIEPSTVQTYFERTAKKLNVKSRQELTLISLQLGLAKLAFF